MGLPKMTDKKEVYLKKRKQAVRMLADVGMAVLLPLLMAYSLIGEAVHEWMGIFMFLLFILHHVLNFSWYRNLFRGHYFASRILRTIADLFLIPVMLALPVSGIMMSRHIFSGLGGSLSFARTSHLFSSYWGFVLMSLHIGLHWRMAVGMAGNLWGRRKMGKGGILMLRVVFIFIALYGVYAFVRRQIGSYMFLQNQFVFFDFGEPRIFFFMDYLAVMCLFAVCGYYAVGGAVLLEKKDMKRKIVLSMAMLAVLLFTGCAGRSDADAHMEGTQQMESASVGTPDKDSDDTESAQNETETDGADRAVLLYQGQASIRIVTAEGKVIYVDPYAGDDYELSADLILVTHPHYDHNMVDKVRNRNPGCEIITQAEAIQNGEHQLFERGYVTVEAVEAGYNSLHDVGGCVGYILTFSDGKSVYVTGDTSTTEQMPLLAEKNIDYAFFCCDGIYNMGLDEAAECAEMVGAKHNIPYHVTAKEGVVFDRELAEQFEAPNRLIIEAGEEIMIE